LDVRDFLRNYWGRAPLVIRGLLPHYHSPISPDELAGLACMPDVESRIVLGSGPSDTVPHPNYALRVGPFDEKTFQKELSDAEPWTLLVQEVNRWHPHVANLLDHFAFLPNWRVDDVMVSYATKGGGVGPHVDNYDVFLLQTAGARRWRFGLAPISHEDECLVPGLDVRVLEGGFEADDDVVLFPGDCLYVPPRFPHWGESLNNDCITYSVGFRAPTVADLAVGWAETASQSQSLSNAFLADEIEDLFSNIEHPARITKRSIDAAYDAVLRALRDSPESRAQFSEWFCEQVSSPKRFREDPGCYELSDSSLREAQAALDTVLAADADEHLQVRQKEGCIFCYRQLSGDRARMYVDGEVALPQCSRALADMVCGKRMRFAADYGALIAQSTDGRTVEQLHILFAKGLLYIAEEDDADDMEEDTDEEEDDIDD
jgi:50S ribosomal protein L16 3-hydroxylase